MAMILFSSLTTISLFDNVSLFIFSSAIALIVTWIAYLKNFFSLPFKDFEGPQVRFFDCLAVFLIFIASYQLLAEELVKFLSKYAHIHNRTTLLSISQLLTFLSTVVLLVLYGLICQGRRVSLKIWKDQTFPLSKPIYQDIGFGVLSWVVAIPMVVATSYFTQTLTDLFFGISEKEQLAVRYLKLALDEPFALFVALFSILIAAPFMEEYLFRGVLQSWLRTRLGPIKAIVVSSVFFAALHYSPQQAVTNIPLLVTLFTFALYLGFIYEKTRSLFAPAFLHVTFNFISAMRIISLSVE
jgi:membrane protease YdiL (CAAX protease family)